MGQRQRHAGDGADRPHPGIEAEAEAEVELRRDLRPVGVADAGPAHGAEQDGVRGLRALKHVLAHCRAGLAVDEGAGLQRLGLEAEAVAPRQLPQHAHRGLGHLHADAVAGHHRDAHAVAA